MFNSLPNVRLVPLTGPQELEHRSGSRACSSPKGCLAIPLSGAVVEVLLNSVTGHWLPEVRIAYYEILRRGVRPRTSLYFAA